MEDTEQGQSVLVIAGMHRSGTSLATSLLQSSGVFIGDRLMEKGTGNLKGHFEDWDFVDLHRDCLTAQAVNREGWTTQADFSFSGEYLARAKTLIAARSKYSIWGWKDPRTTLFLKSWQQLIPQAKFVFVYRSPWDVVDSLFRRGDLVFKTAPEIAINTWISYNQAILKFCAQTDRPWLLLRVEDVIQDPQFMINTVNHQLQLNLRSPQSLYDQSLFQVGTKNFHRAELIRHYFPTAYELYLQLTQQAILAQKAALEMDTQVPLPWLLQNWFHQPRAKARTIRSWYRLKQIAVKSLPKQ
ncbi:MAG: sulfotransferase [Cyanobacteria bacterium P01_G01_bin.39]